MIGTCWAAGRWGDAVWVDGSWAGGVSVPQDAYLEDFVTVPAPGRFVTVDAADRFFVVRAPGRFPEVNR